MTKPCHLSITPKVANKTTLAGRASASNDPPLRQIFAAWLKYEAFDSLSDPESHFLIWLETVSEVYLFHFPYTWLGFACTSKSFPVS